MVWQAISRIVLGSDEDEMKVLEGIRERKRRARSDAADKLECDGKRNIRLATPGPLGDELREQGEKMLKQAEWLRRGEISLLAAMNLTDGDESVEELIERLESSAEGEGESNGS